MRQAARRRVPADRLTFARVAPRLERAHRERMVELVAERNARRHARQDVLRAEWLVSHRELQLLRAGARKNRKYVAERQRKLNAARRALDRAQKRARELGC